MSCSSNAGFLFVHLEKNSGPTKTQVFHKTQVRIGKTQVNFTKNSGFRDFQILTLYSLWNDSICKLEFLPEMGATTVLNEQIQVRSKQKSGQPSKNSGRPEKNSGQKSKNSGPKSKNSGFGIFPYLTKFKKVHKKEAWYLTHFLSKRKLLQQFALNCPFS